MLKKINNSLIALTEKGILPDFIIRFGIRLLLKKRLSDIKSSHCEDASINQMQMISKMDNSPVATNTSDANEQHYEVPADFYKLILGNHFKYSCCYWPDNEKELDDAEVKSLIEENSGNTVSGISNKLDYLITGEKPTKRKVESAKQLNIKIINQEEFLNMLNKTS